MVVAAVRDEMETERNRRRGVRLDIKLLGSRHCRAVRPAGGTSFKMDIPTRASPSGIAAWDGRAVGRMELSVIRHPPGRVATGDGMRCAFSSYGSSG